MAYFKTTGKLVEKSDVKSGTSDNGYDWMSISCILEVAERNGSYTKMQFKARQEMAEKISHLSLGDMVSIGFTLTLDEYDGKKYNRMEVKKVEIFQEDDKQSRTNISEVAPGELEPKSDDMPF